MSVDTNMVELDSASIFTYLYYLVRHAVAFRPYLGTPGTSNSHYWEVRPVGLLVCDNRHDRIWGKSHSKSSLLKQG